MIRDGMPRAYLRIDPNLDQHPDPLSMVKAMCAAARQPDRGRFRDVRILERAVGKRQYREMVTRGDIIPSDPAPGVYLDGWDEWQEGDHTVAERMRRMRDRRRLRAGERQINEAKKRNRVTAESSPDRTDVTTDAVAKELVGIVGVGDSDDSPPPPAGKRENGTNPRALGTNPRATGSSPRQEREARKRGPTRLHEILSAVQKAGSE